MADIFSSRELYCGHVTFTATQDTHGILSLWGVVKGSRSIRDHLNLLLQGSKVQGARANIRSGCAWWGLWLYWPHTFLEKNRWDDAWQSTWCAVSPPRTFPLGIMLSHRSLFLASEPWHPPSLKMTLSPWATVSAAVWLPPQLPNFRLSQSHVFLFADLINWLLVLKIKWLPSPSPTE